MMSKKEIHSRCNEQLVSIVCDAKSKGCDVTEVSIDGQFLANKKNTHTQKEREEARLLSGNRMKEG